MLLTGQLCKPAGRPPVPLTEYALKPHHHRRLRLVPETVQEGEMVTGGEGRDVSASSGKPGTLSCSPSGRAIFSHNFGEALIVHVADLAV